ncbi:hypothetical protein NQ317_006570 [Molorchus minor]|uniref:Uncharacterized protein n=1 Tax=Molorchus minor TaxID=1323400 RepID=A0ABQ9K1U9_9CUCU|nr:hypothetical protein NQ317_006570 [Molorchus minor]
MEVMEELPKDVLEAVAEKSRDKYERTYDIFEKWCQEKGVKTVKEEKVCSVKAPNATSTIFCKLQERKMYQAVCRDKQFREDALRNCGIFKTT